MDIKTKHIDKLKTEQILVDIYTDNYDESDYGFIIDYNDDFLVIEKFDNECNYDGLSIFFRHNITRIRWGGNDLESVFRLIDTTKRQQIKFNIDLTSVETILRNLDETYKHLTVHIQDIDKGVCFIGQIHEMDNKTIVIKEFGTQSTLDRKFIMLSLNDITKIDAGGQYENNLRKLFNE